MFDLSNHIFCRYVLEPWVLSMIKPHSFSTDTTHTELAERYQKDGYLVIEDFYKPEECVALMKRMDELIKQCDINELGGVFSADTQKHLESSKEQYFRESGDKIRFFLEKGAEFSKTCKREELLNKLNKVGHALHDLDPVFSDFSRKPALANLVKLLGLEQPLLVQSMYIFKPPKIGGEIREHQDSSYMCTEPESLIGFWVALEDATLENGCLMVSPGSHLGGLRERLHYKEGDLVMDILDPKPRGDANEPLEVTQGTLVAFHGRLAHRSCANISNKSRHAYTLHIIDGTSKYLPDNWLKRSEAMPFRGF